MSLKSVQREVGSVLVHPRMAREQKTIEAMIDLYCHQRHSTGQGRCDACQALADYARLRLVKCPFQEEKPTCANCPIHCYKSAMREQIRTVMRYAGPRMLLHHPVLAVLHLLDGRRTGSSRVPKRPGPAGGRPAGRTGERPA
jgi:hypothetical protein